MDSRLSPASQPIVKRSLALGAAVLCASGARAQVVQSTFEPVVGSPGSEIPLSFDTTGETISATWGQYFFEGASSTVMNGKTSDNSSTAQGLNIFENVTQSTVAPGTIVGPGGNFSEYISPFAANLTDVYVGIALSQGSDTYYGYAEISTTSDVLSLDTSQSLGASSFTLIGAAMNFTPNEAIEIPNASPVPEPGETAMLVALAAGGAALIHLRRKRAVA